MSALAIIDFETTGLQCLKGDRAIEVAAALLDHNGTITARFDSLVNNGTPITPGITQLTGITSAMVRSAPPAAKVMMDLVRFLNGRQLIAHNASFDRGFLESELHRAGIAAQFRFACTMQISRRVFPDAPTHKLLDLIRYLSIPHNGRAHRALADVELTHALYLAIQREIATKYRVAPLSFEHLSSIQYAKPRDIASVLARLATEASRTAAVPPRPPAEPITGSQSGEGLSPDDDRSQKRGLELDWQMQEDHMKAISSELPLKWKTKPSYNYPIPCRSIAKLAAQESSNSAPNLPGVDDRSSPDLLPTRKLQTSEILGGNLVQWVLVVLLLCFMLGLFLDAPA